MKLYMRFEGAGNGLEVYKSPNPFSLHGEILQL